ncbi:GPI ethanolamine phosphate transferase 1 [Nadsonia fulvescens var. elongata DSM 6958]|uniref:GPI ethanolamine phosphate transferase 1 n=1 Tax=Nadsonia fulvescens var. elongata DSM 6958 TaxID=857566 RepID=A0A1E3PUH7_9ASCO|nr:GPI ethanolamine phosphate transferase 1 [Nadsonia fulvescens var. elongata DSM 6958]
MNLLRQRPLLLVGILFHIAFLWSIFDIYFVSPLVHGMKHHQATSNTAPAPAKRLFFIVGDGMRADKCFDNITHPTTGETGYLAPFIREKALNDGTFGVSHTRMPTESRPGHVAMIAGFYEDVSAVTKGWKENPVDFDSVFNQSRHTWSFGSPDILPMFADGAVEGRIDATMYGHEFEDFTKSSIELDEFVFDHIKNLLNKAKSDPELNHRLREDRVVFFLHLLGIDTAGHGYRPYSAEYYDNIKYIDTKIAEVVQIVEEFYENDHQTAWIVTADHGMSDWGSHGDGHPDNTRTPLVAWGAGVAKPIKDDFSTHDEYSKKWNLPVKRNDINQADLASLMSYLVGINYASNSVGELPLAYLDTTDDVKVKAMRANALTIIEQYLVKQDLQRASQIQFKPYSGLSQAGKSIEDRLAVIDSLYESEKFEEAIAECEELMRLGLKGLRYLQTYNWLFLRTLVTMGFLGWIGYASTSFLYSFVVDGDDGPKPLVRLVASVIGSVLFGLMYYQKSPFNFYFYALFPVLFWAIILEKRSTIGRGIYTLAHSSSPKHPILVSFLALLFAVLILEAIVVGYFHREIFSLCFVIFSIFPWIYNLNVAKRNVKLCLFWGTLCLGMSSYTLLPVIKIESCDQILIAGGLMALLGFVFTVRLTSELKPSKISQALIGVQLGLIPLCMWVTNSSIASLQARLGLPLSNQIMGWAVLVASVIVPFMHNISPVTDYRFRLLIIFLTFSPTFIILTISYEGIFYVNFFLLLATWIELECRFQKKSSFQASAKEVSKEKQYRKITLGSFRLSLFFFFFSQIGFFGTGNVASISSFSLDSVYRLLPIFDPFSMGALLLFKLLSPFIILSACLGILNLRLHLAPSAIFSMSLSVSDILTLNFFYLVVDEGSWLDIGTGISHYCIASLLCLFMILLEGLSEWLVHGVKIEDSVVTNDKKEK